MPDTPLRDAGSLVREMFEARQDLERNLGRIVHKVREEVAVGARARRSLERFARGSGVWIAAIVTGVLVCGAAMALRRRQWH
jgi:hypothetical protein